MLSISRGNDDIVAIRRGIRDKLIQVAVSVENGSVDNVDCEYDLETVIFYLTELSYYEDVNGIIDQVKEPFGLLTSLDDNVLVSNKPNLLYTHRKGRPSFNIPKETLCYYIDNKFTIKQMSGILSVSERTIANKMYEHGLSIRQSYTQIDDEELDAEVKKKVSLFPTVGYRTIKAHLLADGVRITDKRIQKSMRRVDPLGVTIRNLFLRTYRVRRRSYNVPAPLSLWHVDTNHKLIRWRFVFHGGIDGYSRMPMYIVVASDNKADTALQAFLKGVAEYGVPQRVRTDKGKENVKIAEYMLTVHGIQSQSHITGRSVHNQRIERFWREMWQGCTCTFYNLFWSLEGQGILDVDNEMHILALHLVYLPRIQRCLDKFCAAVARRPLRTENQRTPMQMWISGQVLNPAVQLTNQELDLYGLDFSGPVDTNPDQDIVVPPLYELDDNIMNELEVVRCMNADDPYEFQTFLEVCSRLPAR
ncbi:uncharacterized protein LOC123555860 [Mercenaria mercenaria]|uniref:uncharacterized protein LOC123555860 n=1 Tax=Mercenaria mercenaria TaxID=6596 RepID=UPI00234F83AC|nr:uncharacterized protein LOC123555860 [Mercenaria mercenaria]